MQKSHCSWKKVKMGEKKVYIEKTQLFNRLIIMAERDEGIENVFSFELTPVPTALFTMDRMMRKPNKHEFGAMLKASATKVEINGDKIHVIDGGWLLHQVKWTSGATIKTIVDTYVQYINGKFKNPTVVFDGYDGEPSTKDHEHRRRKVGKNISPEFRVTSELTILCDREVFLANEKNKGALISILSSVMARNNIDVHQAKDDGDTVIVKTAIDMVKSMDKPVVVVARDTDILVLLCYHRPSNCTNLFMLSDFSGVYDISTFEISNLDEFLFKYGWSGNDTVSKIHGHTKCSVYKLTFPQNIINTFTSLTSPKSEIQKAGTEAMLITYNCENTNLQKARYSKFQKQAATGRIDPDRLPPTENSTTQHSLRVHHQLVTWKYLDSSMLNPIGRGWELDSVNKLKPKMITGSIAPYNLLKGICCSCKNGEKQCETMKCSCMKAGMLCVSACTYCSGHCTNASLATDNEEFSDEEATAY